MKWPDKANNWQSWEVVATEKIANELLTMTTAFIQSWGSLKDGETLATHEVAQLAVSSEKPALHNFDAQTLTEILNILKILANNLDKNDLSATKVAGQLQDHLNGNYA